MNFRKSFRKLTFLFAFVLIAAFGIAQTQTIGPYGNLPFTLNNTATDTATLTVGQIVGLLTGTPTAAATYTTPSATALCNIFPFVASSNASSFVFDFYVRNTAASTYTITLAGGSGVTLRGTGTAAQNAMRHFKIELTACNGTPAANLYSLETATF